MSKEVANTVSIDDVIVFDDRFIVETLDEEVTQGGIHLVKNDGQGKSQKAIIRSAGPDSMDHESIPTDRRMRPEPGDMVYISSFAGIELSVSEGDYKIIRTTDIMGLVKKQDHDAEEQK